MNQKGPQAKASSAILWLVPKWPLPAHDGARSATCSLIQGLTQLGQTIDLWAFPENTDRPDTDAAKSILGVRNCFIKQRWGASHNRLYSCATILGSLLRSPQLPLTMRHFQNPLILPGQYKAVVYDGLHVAAHSAHQGRYQALPGSPAIIYRAHNREATIWERKANLATGAIKLLLAQQAKRVKIFEDSLVDQLAGLATVSLTDLELFNVSSTTLTEVVPIAFNFTAPLATTSKQLRLLFVGKLDWPPNSEGLKWFLSEVWPQVYKRRPSITLTIVGSGGLKGSPKLLGQPGISFHGRAADLTQFYANTSLCIAPVFYGSGTRVKVIEAANFGRAVVSTAMGVEGLPFTNQHYFQAETCSDWVELLSNMTSEKAHSTGLAAFDVLKSEYSIHGAATRFLNLLNSIATK